MKYSRFEDLPVWKAGARLFVRIDKLCEDAEVTRRGDLADQLHRATLSITNNIAEGFEQGTTQQLLTHLYHAKGSAGEVRSMLQEMLGIARLQHLKPELLGLRTEVENISRQIHAFADSLQNSEIEGQRYLTDDAREATERAARRDAFDLRIKAVMAKVLEKQGVGGAPENDAGVDRQA